MRFPYGKNRRIMEKEYSEMAVICRKENESEEMIEQMHDLLLHQLNRDRAVTAVEKVLSTAQRNTGRDLGMGAHGLDRGFRYR